MVPGPRVFRWKWRSVVSAPPVIVSIVYAFLSLIYTYPALLRLRTHMLTAWGDGPMFLWNTWWAPYALFRLGTNPLHTEYLYYPEGASLILNTHHVLPSLTTAPLQGLFGLVPAYNLMILSTYVLAALGAYLLANEILSDRRAAFVAGLAFSFGHIRTSMLVFANLIQTHLLVFFVWALWAAYKRRSLRFAVLAGVLSAAMAYTSYNLLLLAAIFTILFCVFVSIVSLFDRYSIMDLFKQWATVGVIAAVLVIPLAVGVGNELNAHGDYVSSFGSLAYQEVVPLERFFARTPLDAGPANPFRHASYLGWSVLILSLLACVSYPRKARVWFWVVIAGLFLFISVGPRLVLSWPLPDGARDPSGLRMPFAYLSGIPILQQIREAHRYAIVGWMACAVLAGYGVRALLALIGRYGRGTTARVVFVVVSCAVFIDFIDVPFCRLYELPRVPDAVEEIRKDRRLCAVLEYPGGRRGYVPFAHIETLHRKPVYLDGQIARIPEQLKDRRAESPLLRSLDTIWNRGSGALVMGASDHAAIREEAAENRIGWVILAWADKALWRWDRGFPTTGQLQAMDALIQDVLPIDECVFAAPDDAFTRWKALPRREWPSQSCIYRIYRLSLDDPPNER
jgi:hypothetical protein